MTMAETKKIIATMMVLYSNYKPSDIDMTVMVWHSVIGDYSYRDVSMALSTYARTCNSGFAPSPGQLIDKIHTLNDPHELNAQQAWELVSEAITNSAYNSGQEFAKLPPLVQKAVGSPRQLTEWALTENLNHEVAKANFTRLYTEEVRKQREYNCMSSDLKSAMEQNRLQDKYLAQLEAKNAKLGKSVTDDDKILEIESSRKIGPMPKKLQEKVRKWQQA